ncbi:MAG: hypothetical protein PHC61_04735, partial [Chitinivibrionales bacterium]|nr:hypothetical protein [Chitinivibrionales bacterium]
MRNFKRTWKRHWRIWFFLLCAGIGAFCFADGLPGEYLVTQRWRDLLSPYSPLTNPAFLTEENYVAVRACESFILDNSFRLTEAGITFPVGMKESWGFSYFGENAGKVDQYYTDPATGNPVALNSTVSNSNNLFMFSYANNLWTRLSLGVNFNVSYQTNFSARLDSGII